MHWVPSFAGQMQKSGSFMEMDPLVTVLLNLILLQGTRSVISIFCWLKVIFLAHSWENGFKYVGSLQVAWSIIVKSAFPDLLCPLTVVMFFILSFSKDFCNFPVSLACTQIPCFLQGHYILVMQPYHLDITSSCVCDLNYFVNYKINWTFTAKNPLKLSWQDD